MFLKLMILKGHRQLYKDLNKLTNPALIIIIMTLKAHNQENFSMKQINNNLF